VIVPWISVCTLFIKIIHSRVVCFCLNFHVLQQSPKWITISDFVWQLDSSTKPCKTLNWGYGDKAISRIKTLQLFKSFTEWRNMWRVVNEIEKKVLWKQGQFSYSKSSMQLALTEQWKAIWIRPTNTRKKLWHVETSSKLGSPKFQREILPSLSKASKSSST